MKVPVSPGRLGARLLATIAAIGVAAIGVGCGASDEPEPVAVPALAIPTIPTIPTIPPKTPKPPKPVDPNRIREDLRATVDLPDYYPEDAPTYPGSKTNNAGWQSGRVTAVFSTEDPADQVSEALRAELIALGWDDLTVEEMPNGEIAHASKEARGLSVLISVMDEGTEYEQTLIVVAVDPKAADPEPADPKPADLE